MQSYILLQQSLKKKTTHTQKLANIFQQTEGKWSPLTICPDQEKQTVLLPVQAQPHKSLCGTK